MNQPASLVVVLLFVAILLTSCLARDAAGAGGGTYAKLEASFELPQMRGNPFDFTANDVKVTFAGPDGRDVTVPAFFDGGTTWRARHTPASPGKHAIKAVTLNGADANPQAMAAREFEVPDDARAPGFVRMDPGNKYRFVLDDGSPYYPVGYNLAWRHMGTPPMPPLVESIGRMGKARVNWTRIWMNHWDGKNLDWFEDREQQPELGKLSLPAAKAWDEIVAAAEANGVYFQMVLQHHGQYSTTANSNWNIHPWNKANGGWLDSPIQFFSDPKAIELTRAKYRYIIARWGYSPAVMAWELFNEVEYTDAFREDLPAVARWHEQMAAFLREHDVYDHLVTTSSRTTEPSIWPAMDYYQSHVYPPDIVSAIATLEAEQLDRAYFYGEIGSGGAGEDDASVTIHTALWPSLMSRSAGAAQFWTWYIVEPQNLLYHYTSVQAFLEQSGFRDRSNLRPIEVDAETRGRAPLRFGPGSGWAASKNTEFTIKPTGHVEGLGGMSAYLQGHGGNREMFPFAQLNVDYTTSGTFAVRVDEYTPEGARLEVSLDGQPVTSLELGATPQPPPGAGAGGQQRHRRTPRVHPTNEIPDPAGPHTIRLENTGRDWVHLRQFTLTPYAPELAVLAKADKELAVLWVYRRDAGTPSAATRPAATQATTQPVAGTLHVPELADGTYRVAWWDTYAGKVVKEETATASGGQPLTLATPPIAQDLAAWIRRDGAR
jgi:hypothetical protein